MKRRALISCGIVLVLLISGLLLHFWGKKTAGDKATYEIPPFDGRPYVTISDNVPSFSENEITDRAYEFYSELDALNRCGYVMACIGPEIMPNEERGSIGQIKPSGWQTVKYDFVDGKYLYNRCHLIGYQLTGENANERNLITGTRYLNISGMLPFENMVADYIKETKNHVMYRVTPDFVGEETVARGVHLEGWSVEDNGEGICFNVYCYNVQPGVEIDYKTGLSSEAKNSMLNDETIAGTRYILNTSSKKFHLPSCGQAESMNPDNMEVFNGNRDELISKGYLPALCCDP